MSLRAGEEVHFVALLDASGTTIVTVPMLNPLKMPKDQQLEDVRVDVRVNLTTVGKASR